MTASPNYDQPVVFEFEGGLAIRWPDPQRPWYEITPQALKGLVNEVNQCRDDLRALSEAIREIDAALESCRGVPCGALRYTEAVNTAWFVCRRAATRGAMT